MVKIPDDIYGEFGDCRASPELLEVEYKMGLAYAGRKNTEKYDEENSLEFYMKNFWYGT